MIDSSKKQQQGFPEILPVGDIEPLKEKECLDANSPKSLKEGQFPDLVGRQTCTLVLGFNRMGLGQQCCMLASSLKH